MIQTSEQVRTTSNSLAIEPEFSHQGESFSRRKNSKWGEIAGLFAVVSLSAAYFTDKAYAIPHIPPAPAISGTPTLDGDRLIVPIIPTINPTEIPEIVPTVPVITPEPTRPLANTGYTAARGDTLAKIAARYGITVQDLMKANGITSPDLLKTGQKLDIPQKTDKISSSPQLKQPTITPKEIESLSPIIPADGTAEESSYKVIPVETADKVIQQEKMTGKEMIEAYKLDNKTIYLVYGRPGGHGSLGTTKTPAEAWNKTQERAKQISQLISVNSKNKKPDIGWLVLNPTYNNDAYVMEALKLANMNDGIVAPSFNSIQSAKTTLDRLFKNLPAESLSHLSCSLDLEWFKDKKTSSYELNNFIAWFNEKRINAGINKIKDEESPAFVFVYTINPNGSVGGISDLKKLKQYYPEGGVIVVPIIDGFGTIAAKKASYNALINRLQDNSNYPAIGGIMEFVLKWGAKYDTGTVNGIYNILSGEPFYVFASQ